MFPVAKVTSKTKNGDKIITGAKTHYVDPAGSGGPSISVNVNGSIYTYSAEEVEAQNNDDNFDREDVSKESGEAPEQEEEDNSDNNDVQPNNQDCSTVTSDVKYNSQLTQRFKVSDVSSKAAFPHKIKAQNGLSSSQIICNLKNTVENTVEKIADSGLASRKNMIITSGFRSGSGKSQHLKGEAIDLQISGYSNEQYWELAKWVKDNVAYDQLILEYHGKRPVIHMSYKTTGTLRKQVLTTPDLKTYYTGLRKLR